MNISKSDVHLWSNDEQKYNHFYYWDLHSRYALMTKKLMLLSCEHTPFTSKRTGQKVDGYKYIFIKPDGTYLTTWGRSGAFKSDATGKMQYDDSLAREYPFRISEFQGKYKEIIDEGFAVEKTQEEQ